MANSRKPNEQPGSGTRDPQGAAEHLTKNWSESAQQVWLAGIGALGRAQVEGSKLFESLVKEGSNMERGARQFADSQADAARDTFDSGVGQARNRMADTWGRLEKTFEERVQQTLTRLGVPSRSELADLSRRVDALSAELRQQKSGRTARAQPATPHPPAAKRAVNPAVRKPAAKKAAPRKTVRSAAASRPAAKP